MDEKKIRAIVLKCFEATRQKPGAPYDDDNFLDALMADGRRLADLHKGLAGMRRLNAFYNKLQTACVVCFEPYEKERDWTLDMLVERIADLKSDINMQRSLVKAYLNDAEHKLVTEPAKIGGFVALPSFLVVWSIIGGWMEGALLFTLAALASYCVYLLQTKNVAYYRKLLELMGKPPATPASPPASSTSPPPAA